MSDDHMKFLLTYSLILIFKKPGNYKPCIRMSVLGLTSSEMAKVLPVFDTTH